MGYRHRTAALLIVASGLVLVPGCGGGDDGGPNDPTPTAAAHTSAGWDHFEAGRYGDADDSFVAALGAVADHAPAHVGRGWVRLVTADSDQTMLDAAASFTAAAAAGETGPDMSGGRAAARLGSGGVTLTGAVTDAMAALVSAPNYVFDHRTSFDGLDLRLIAAFAAAGLGDLDGALSHADLVRDSGIDPAVPGSWVVETVVYPNYAAAVLAYLEDLSEEFAG